MTVLHLPSLSALRAVEAAVRLSGIGKAARELNLTDGAVSRSVRDVEQAIGGDLFVRQGRTVRPTASAEQLAAELRAGFATLTNAIRDARSAMTARRTLTLSCEPTFLIRWLIPRLADLEMQLGGEFELRIVAAGGPVSFIRDAIDLAIRRTDFPVTGELVVERFLAERVGPVCRPGTVSAHFGAGAVSGTLLHTKTRPSAWAEWAEHSGMKLAPTRHIELEHFYQTLQAAVAGAGCAIGPHALVTDDLTAGALVAPAGFVADGSHYALLALRVGANDVGYRAVLAWLREAFRYE